MFRMRRNYSMRKAVNEKELLVINKKGKLLNAYVMLEDLEKYCAHNSTSKYVPFYRANGKVKNKNDFSKIIFNVLTYKGNISIQNVSTVLFTFPAASIDYDLVSKNYNGIPHEPLYNSSTNTKLRGVQISFDNFINMIREILNSKLHDQTDNHRLCGGLFDSITYTHSLALLDNNENVVCYVLRS